MKIRWTFDWPEQVPPTEYSRSFIQGMLNRMAVAFYGYGTSVGTYPHKINAIRQLKRRLEMYEQTGNTEWLMDVANFAMLEHQYPAHPRAHFRATGEHESPGREFLKRGKG